MLFQGIQARAATGTFRDVKQQVAQQLGSGWLTDSRWLLLELTQTTVCLPQQLTDGTAITDRIVGQALGNTGKQGPELGPATALAQALKAGKHLDQLLTVGDQILFADHAELGDLQDLTQLAQLLLAVLIGEIRQCVARTGRGNSRPIIEYRALRQQFFTARTAHVVEQG